MAVEYVTAADVATAQGVTGPGPIARSAQAAASANVIVDNVLGSLAAAQVAGADEIPDPFKLAALTIAMDLYRRPDTPGGYFVVADYTARLSADPASPVLALIRSVDELVVDGEPFRLVKAWPIA